MENCNVKQLKKVVSNGNLKYPGELRYQVGSLPSGKNQNVYTNVTFNVVSGKTLTYKAIIGSWTDSSHLGLNSVGIIQNVYDLVEVSDSGSKCGVYIISPMSAFKFADNIISIQCHTDMSIDDFADKNVKSNVGSFAFRGNPTGSVESLKDYTNLDYFMTTSSQIIGNIAVAFGKMTKLATLNINASGRLSGFVDDMLNAMVSNGRTSGTMSLSTMRPRNADTPGSMLSKTVKFGSSMVNPTTEETTQGWQISA